MAHEESTRDRKALIDAARATPDNLYKLLDLDQEASATDEQLKKAWRRVAFKHHPDKNRGNEEAAAAKYDVARKAFEILSDAEARAAFDARQAAQKLKQQRDGEFDARRRKLKEDLEARESAAKGKAPKRPAEGQPNGFETAAKMQARAFASATRPSRMDATEAELLEMSQRGRLAVQELQAKRRREADEAHAAQMQAQAQSRTALGSDASSATPSDTRPKFSFGGTGTPTSAAGAGTGAGSANLHQSVMARLRQAQRDKEAREQSTPPT